MLEKLRPQSQDPLWALTGAVNADPRPERMDLLIGVYRDAAGQTPVMRAVHAAELVLAERADTKAYRPLSGDETFNAGMAALLLGEDRARARHHVCVQTTGGTAALRLLADLVVAAEPGATVWVSDPGYANHRPIMEAAGLRVDTFRWRENEAGLDLGPMLEDLARMRRGDVLLIQGCCHNPTGIDLPADAWPRIAELCAASGAVPLVDMAYQGLGDGMEEDARGLRLLADRLGTVLVAASCSKNMGLYCERTGAALVLAPGAGHLDEVRTTMEQAARRIYSMAPHHGAAIATLVLVDPAAWLAEVDAMRDRIVSTRQALKEALARHGAPPALLDIGRHKGMFSVLPFGPAAMERLRTEHAVYGTPSGRINVAGVAPDQVEQLARALVGVAAGTDRVAVEAA